MKLGSLRSLKMKRIELFTENGVRRIRQKLENATETALQDSIRRRKRAYKMARETFLD